MTKPILILGGAGKTGRHITRQLQERGVPVRLASRSSEQRFDWYDESTWSAAVAGTDTAYLAPPYEPAGCARAVQFINQAPEDGLRRVVLLSGRGVGGPGREFDVYQGQLDVENAVRDSGVDWTIVKPAWFMQNFSEDYFRDQVQAGEIRTSAGNGAEAWIDTEDVADVMVAALLDETHTGGTYSLSGPRLLTLTEAAAEFSAATGREIRYIDLDPEAHVAELMSYGMVREEAEPLRDLFAVIRLHRSEYVSDGIQQVLGREPRDFSDWARSTAQTGVWSA